MSATPAPPSVLSILAVVVLYDCPFEQSHSVSSLFQVLQDDAALAQHFSIVLYDNSPQPQSFTSPAEFAARYVHDVSNGGLATAYNYALACAESEKRAWLLLLDQDTTLTRAYVSELVEAVRKVQDSAAIAAIVPKLLVRGEVHSPAIPFLEQMRRQFLPSNPPIRLEIVGVLQQQVCPYNSGSTLRVSALRSIGGFPQEFWLDFLDHAVYRALQMKGYRVYLLLAALVHDASYADVGSLSLWRVHNVISAQTLFVKQNGNFTDRLLYRLWLLRRSRNFRLACKDPRVWREAVRQALLFRAPKAARPSPPAPLAAP